MTPLTISDRSNHIPTFNWDNANKTQCKRKGTDDGSFWNLNSRPCSYLHFRLQKDVNIHLCHTQQYVFYALLYYLSMWVWIFRSCLCEEWIYEQPSNGSRSMPGNITNSSWYIQIMFHKVSSSFPIKTVKFICGSFCVKSIQFRRNIFMTISNSNNNFASLLCLLRKWHIWNFNFLCLLLAEIQNYKISNFPSLLFAKMLIPLVLIKIQSSFLY
jgi:hypothetical protein